MKMARILAGIADYETFNEASLPADGYNAGIPFTISADAGCSVQLRLHNPNRTVTWTPQAAGIFQVNGRDVICSAVLPKTTATPPGATNLGSANITLGYFEF